MDPLSALRDFTMRDEVDKIVQVGDEFRFGNDYSFPCNVATAYKSKQGIPFTLEALVILVKNHHVKHTDYMQYARNHNHPVISYVDRKPLLDYLQGKVSSSDAIQFVAPQNPKFSSDQYRPEDPALIPSDTQNDIELGQNDDFEVRDSENYITMFRAVERPLKDRETVLECPKRNFYSVLLKEEERQRAEVQQRKEGLVAKSRLMRGDERGFGDDYGYDATPKPKIMIKGSKIGEGVPIILVPSAFQTLITIYNVKEFLEDGVFIPTDAKVKTMKGTKPDCVTVQKKFSRDKIVTAYEVRDKPTALKPEDWDRVVAVFVLGKEWQFKDWPFKDHVEIFNKILGFYMRFEDDSVESAKTVKQWNVKIISISKNKRHQDRAAALEVWDRLEEFVRSRSRG